MHGGAIGFASKAGIGSTFSFYVKSRKCDAPPPKAVTDAALDLSIRTQTSMLGTRSRSGGNADEARHIATKLVDIQTRLKDLHVLIVEDNLVNQRVLAKQLRNLGMDVVLANHGGEALDHLRTTTYCDTRPSARALSLILMDWEMPVMDGLTCVREIRRLQKQGVVHGHVPVIAVTANVRSDQVSFSSTSPMDSVVFCRNVRITDN
jgi:CheY-like chemotaxis protein